jgi:hypothetical protein
MATTDAGRREAARARVRRLLAAARIVADDGAIVAPLVSSTGLSREGVLLGLSRYLETDASDAELDALLDGARPASRVHVILSANVFTAPLRALAVAWAASERVTVRPSRRDPVLTCALLYALDDDRVALAEATDVSSVTEGEIHVYGRDETVMAVATTACAGVVVRGHGAGMGVAFVDVSTECERAAYAIAEDVVVFDQRGCLSPRVVLVEGDASRVDEVAEALSARLGTLATAVPRGRLDESEKRDAARYVATMAFAGRVRKGDAYAVGVGGVESAIVIPPTGRHVHVLGVSGCEAARTLLAPLARFIVTIGCDDPTKGQALLADPARVRVSRLGRMQRPPLDGPVDARGAEIRWVTS